MAAGFWVIPPCRLVEVYRRFRPDDTGKKHLRNVGKLVPKYTAQELKRQPPSKFRFVSLQVGLSKLTRMFSVNMSAVRIIRTALNHFKSHLI
jgi:hypothetical protein